MGGFHGGHGHSGGGFHGGHSGGHSSSRYSGGYHSVHIHSHYYGGEGGEGGPAPYGTLNGRPMKFKGGLAFMGCFILIGLVLFLACLSFKTKAIVTNAYDNGYYELYDFEYSAYGNTYKGHGDDDFGYYGTYTVLPGEEYTIYYKAVAPQSYSFDSPNVATVIGVFFMLVGAIGIVSMCKTHKKRMEMARKVGDVNHDGKVDEDDLDAVPTESNKESAPKSEAPKMKKCPYCDSSLPANATKCPSCGATNLD